MNVKIEPPIDNDPDVDHENDPTGLKRLLDNKRYTNAEHGMSRSIEHLSAVSRDHSFTLLRQKALQHCVQDVHIAFQSILLNRYQLIDHVRQIERIKRGD